MEQRLPRTIEMQPELLGHHYTEACLAEQAIPYWKRAGEIAVRRSANREAAGHFAKGLKLLESLPETPELIQHELDLQTALGTELMATKGYGVPEVKQAFDRAWELCQKIPETPQLIPVLHGLWIFYLARAELKTSLEIAEQIFNLAKRVQDPVSLREAHHVLGSNYMWLGEYKSSRTHFEQAITLYDSQPHVSDILHTGRKDPGVTCRSHIAEVIWILGYPEQAQQIIQEAIDLAQELCHPYSICFALLSAALVYLFRGDAKKARELAASAVTISIEHEFGLWLAMSKVYLGSALATQGMNEEGITQIYEGFNASEDTGTKVIQPHSRVLLAEAYGKAGKIREGLAVLDESQMEMEDTGVKYYEAELHRIRGELLQMQSTPDENGVARNYQKAIDIAQRRQAKSLELRASVSLSRLLQKQGKREEARKLMESIYGWFTEGLDTTDLKEAKALLHQLS
jgi:predicted ATPase